MKAIRWFLVLVLLCTGFGLKAQENKVFKALPPIQKAEPPFQISVKCDAVPSGLTISCTDYCSPVKNACLKYGTSYGGATCNQGDNVCCGSCEEVCKEVCHEMYMETYCWTLCDWCNPQTCPLPSQCQGTYETENAYGKTVYKPALQSPECKNSPGYQTYLQCVQANTACSSCWAKIQSCQDFYQ